ncbi:RsmB/NOP family class I SAM-dependent RNA methyltransferase [Microcoleus sp. FACHB-1515]|uniref:RsmB/NOP family class I SAM-dependent RNA methyltransferase n=1 Tax=Cyanophyceae TaxID=3028117 RepID=UPI0016854A1F|nr:RsmB/NOP family class I SAM-dependent RNA methyltransferase [Microcoleus sp. FACHB-1515]MBD2091465.1 RsmB/NOP family class I SAM-dependent RNA methyltransferase [Microcoleus sp. FACHB-1515]
MEASNLLRKLAQRLFDDPIEQAGFIDALIQPQPFSPCILWCHDRPIEPPFEVIEPLSWQPKFVDRLAIGTKPGQNVLHQQGDFYCLDFSSVFAASVLQAIEQPISIALDMCASPGGKSIFAWQALQPELLLCNEVIGKRIGALVSNLKRCRIQQSATLNVDSQILANEIAGAIDLVIVDAPCTGQSLLAKGDKALGCFHPVNINKNANRQKRILANSAQIVAPQCYLAYMTCAYSLEENEQVAEWLLSKFPQFEAIEIPHLASYRSHLTNLPCYRLFPQFKLGAGSFTILLQNQAEGKRSSLSDQFLSKARFIS